jgi:protein-L-isoaspartate(D-aspartate) O-methyltransferase
LCFPFKKEVLFTFIFPQISCGCKRNFASKSLAFPTLFANHRGMVSFNESKRYAADREQMLRCHLRGRDITDTGVLEVMGRLPREAFVSPSYDSRAYDDNPLPIGMGQTISQPYIVALMTQCLKLTGVEDVLEIGTGSGYQTAVLASLARRIYTVERFNGLAESAQTVLSRLGFENIDYYIGDGSGGWPEKRVFERIIVTAAVPSVPEPLLEQLADGGILVAPVGPEGTQELQVVEKYKDQITAQSICACRFVKLVGRYGFGE